MDYGRVFTNAWHITWQHRFLWLLGFILGLGGHIGRLARILIGSDLPRRLDNLEQWLTQPDALLTLADLPLERLGIAASWLIFGSFVVLIGGWLVVTLAEGAIIGAALGLEQGQRVTLPQALKMGWGFLARFIAIDTIVYFPAFLVMLVAMILMLLVLVAMAFLAADNVSTTALASPLLIIVFCVLPLLCLLLPLGYGIAAFRALAFRDTAVCGTGVRAVVRHTWEILRQHFWAIFLLAIIVGGLQYLLNAAISILTIPIFALIAAPGLLTLINGTTPITAVTLLILFFTLLVESLIVLVQSVVHAYTATVWTLAYQELIVGQDAILPSEVKLRPS